MKITYKNVEKLHKKLITFSMGDDETRYTIHGKVYHHPELNALISTNGHILTKSELLFDPESSGKILDLVNYKIATSQFPNVGIVCPHKLNSGYLESQVTIDKFRTAKNTKEKVYFYKKNEKDEFLSTSYENLGNALFCLNAYYISPLANLTLDVSYNPNGMFPVVFSISTISFDPQNQFIVMPIKL